MGLERSHYFSEEANTSRKLTFVSFTKNLTFENPVLFCVILDQDRSEFSTSEYETFLQTW